MGKKYHRTNLIGKVGDEVWVVGGYAAWSPPYIQKAMVEDVFIDIELRKYGSKEDVIYKTRSLDKTRGTMESRSEYVFATEEEAEKKAAEIREENEASIETNNWDTYKNYMNYVLGYQDKHPNARKRLADEVDWYALNERGEDE